jgi:hypothetical protein
MDNEERGDLEKRLAQLPHRARVAVAARCARRVEPLTWGLEAEVRTAVSRAIGIAEKFACGERSGASSSAAARVSAATVRAAAARVSAAAYAGDAARATVRAAAARVSTYATDAAASDAAAAEAAAAAARFADAVSAYATNAANWTLAVTDLPSNLMPAVLADIEKLEALRLGSPNETGDPIDSSEAGPIGTLWPHGAPWWYTNPSGLESDDEQFDNPPLLIVWDPEIVSAEQYAKLVSTIGDLVRSEGGLGIERIRSRGFGVPSQAGVVQ